MIYLIGSLRNPSIPIHAEMLRAADFHVFDDWFSTGPRTDEHWQEYEKLRGRSYKQALAGAMAENAFQFDKRNLDACEAAVMVAPYGKSAMAEMGYLRGRGVPVFVLLDGEPERYDLMLKFASGIEYTMDDIIERLHAALA